MLNLTTYFKNLLSGILLKLLMTWMLTCFDPMDCFDCLAMVSYTTGYSNGMYCASQTDETKNKIVIAAETFGF